MSRPAIHALHGFLGSCKTGFACRLEHDLPGLRFSSDEGMVALHGQDPPAAHFGDLRSKICALMRRQWIRALQLGVPVILDEGLWTRRERDELRAQAAALGFPLTIYALSTPEKVARARIRRRNAEPGNLYIAENTYDLLRSRFEALEPEEAHVVVWAGQ